MRLLIRFNAPNTKLINLIILTTSNFTRIVFYYELALLIMKFLILKKFNRNKTLVVKNYFKSILYYLTC